MTSTQSKNWKDWPTPPMLEETQYSKNPAAILRAMKRMRTRRMVGFHLAEMEGARASWSHATFAAAGNPSLVLACAEQRDKWQHWINELKAGIIERRQEGVMFIERRDWPSVYLFDMAIAALEAAEITDITH